MEKSSRISNSLRSSWAKWKDSERASWQPCQCLCRSTACRALTSFRRQCPISQLREIADLARAAGEREVWPFFDLRIVIVFTVPFGDISGRGEPDFAVALRVADELAKQERTKRSSTDERVIAPHHELGIAFALFVEAIEAILPHLQQIPRRSAGALIAGVVIQVLKIG